MRNHRLQIRPSNWQIASMADCWGPMRQATAQVVQQGRPVRRLGLPRSLDDCQKIPPPIHTTTNTSGR